MPRRCARPSRRPARRPFAGDSAEPRASALLRPAGLALCLAAGAAVAQTAPPESAAPLQTVVVSATRHAMPLADAPAAMTVIDRSEIELRSPVDLLDALRGEAGVTVFGRTIAGRKAMSLRGLDPKHTLFLVDGRRISASDGVIGHTDFQLDWVPMEEIDRIEVVRGPLAALYGAEAMGGVVQVFTRAPSTTKLEASGAVEGSWADSDRGGDGHRVAARLSGPLAERLAGTLSASATRRQAVASAIDPRLSDLEGRDKQDLALRLRFAASAAHAIDLEHREGREERWNDAIERSGKRRLYQSVSDIDRSHTALTWNADWGGAGEWRSVLRAYESRLEMTNERNNGVASLRPNRLQDGVVDLQWSGAPAASHLLTGGVELREEQLDNEGLPGGEAEASHRSVYVQDEFAATRALALTAGLRFDEHERFGGEWSPRLYAVWRLAPQWVLKGGYSHGFKPPTLKQITPGYQEDEGPYTYFSNPDLQAETNDGVEVGVAWDTPRAGVQAMLFHNRVENLILPRQIAATGPRASFVFDNIAHARLRGAELSGVLRVAAGWTLGASYQYLDARDGDGQRLERRPRHTLGLSADWRSGPWLAGLRLDSTAGQLMPAAVPSDPLQPVPPLSYLSLNVSREIGKGLTLQAGVRNLTDVNPVEKSALYTWGEAPRTLRVALRGKW